jgi:putative transcriptional regulator
MSTVRHPSEEALLSFACGDADLPSRVLAEAHLAHCPGCRAAVAELARPGAILLRTLGSGSEPVAPELWERVRAAVAASSPLEGELGLPPGASAELPARPPLRWRSLASDGSAVATVWAAGAAGPAKSPASTAWGLLVAARGPRSSRFPAHEHVGREEGVVLAGGYDDERGSYLAGDWVAYEAGSRHRPTTDHDEGCTILVALQVPNRLLGWRGLAQRLFF